MNPPYVGAERRLAVPPLKKRRKVTFWASMAGLAAALSGLATGLGAYMHDYAVAEAAKIDVKVEQHDLELAEIRDHLDRMDETLTEIQVSVGVLLERTGIPPVPPPHRGRHEPKASE